MKHAIEDIVPQPHSNRKGITGIFEKNSKKSKKRFAPTNEYTNQNINIQIQKNEPVILLKNDISSLWKTMKAKKAEDLPLTSAGKRGTIS